MIRRTTWLGILLLVAGQAAALEQTTQVMAIRDGIDQAVLEGDGDALAAYREQLADAQGDWADYYRAYADYRLSRFPGAPKNVMKALLNECIDTLDNLLERRPELAEAYALQATCYGLSTQFYVLRAAVRGASAGKALEQALKLGSGNPRVLLQDAQSLISRPAIFGGDKEQAMETLMLAAEIFPNWRSPDPEAPVWGAAHTWLTMAGLYRDAGNMEQARAAYTEALRIAPGFRRAREELQAID